MAATVYPTCMTETKTRQEDKTQDNKKPRQQENKKTKNKKTKNKKRRKPKHASLGAGCSLAANDRNDQNEKMILYIYFVACLGKEMLPVESSLLSLPLHCQDSRIGGVPGADRQPQLQLSCCTRLSRRRQVLFRSAILSLLLGCPFSCPCG